MIAAGSPDLTPSPVGVGQCYGNDSAMTAAGSPGIADQPPPLPAARGSVPVGSDATLGDEASEAPTPPGTWKTLGLGSWS